MINQNLLLHNSKILPLHPFIRNEFLHFEERLKNSFLPEESKHPIILPKDHHVTKPIVEFIRKSNRYCGWDHLVSLTREKYWIVSCKSVCRRLANVCLCSKRQRLKRQQQFMSDFPDAQSAVFDPPFTHSGVDYFSPITIKRGKWTRASTGTAKRYAVIFNAQRIKQCI